jgi:hypothetical protein
MMLRRVLAGLWLRLRSATGRCCYREMQPRALSVAVGFAFSQIRAAILTTSLHLTQRRIQVLRMRPTHKARKQTISPVIRQKHMMNIHATAPGS